MKILCSCMRCTVWEDTPSVTYQSGKHKITVGPNGYNNRKIILAVNEEGALDFTCENGHQNTLYIQNKKFSLLCAIGADAILDGYYREAISAFAAALESFYDYYLQVITQTFAIKDEEFQSAWKDMKLSERRLGGFVFAYLLHNGKPPSLLSNKNVALRNRVIHNGEIPSRQDCMNYGQAVLDFINPILVNMEQRLVGPMYVVNLKSNSSRAWKIAMDEEKPEYGRQAWEHIRTPLTEHFPRTDGIFKTLEEYLLEYEPHKKLFDIYPLNHWFPYSAEIVHSLKKLVDCQ